MPQRVIVHVGTAKTGSTALQQYMHSNPDILAERDIYYPPSPNRLNHHHLASAIRNGPESLIAAFDDAVKSRPQDARTVFLSYEGIYSQWLKNRQVTTEGFQRVAERYPLEIWVVFREPLDFLRSLHNHIARDGRTAIEQVSQVDFGKWMDNPKIARECDYSGFVQSVMDILPAPSLHVRPYSRSVVRDTLDALGIDFKGKEPRLNLAASANALDKILDIRTSSIAGDQREKAVRQILDRDRRKILARSKRDAPSPEIMLAVEKLRAKHGGIITATGARLADHWREQWSTDLATRAGRLLKRLLRKEQ